MASTLPLETNETATFSRLRKISGEELSITIDNVNFEDDHDFVISKKNLGEVIFQIINTGPSNALAYEIYTNNANTPTPPAFDFKWKLFPNGVGRVSEQGEQAFRIRDVWVWLLIRLKRGDTGVNTTGEIRYESGERR